MRKLLCLTVVSATALVILPSVALARSEHHRRHHHGTERHHVRHARAGHARLGSDSSRSSSREHASGADNGAGAGMGTGSDQSGQIVSFEGGVLTIKATDGSMSSGHVTNATEIECQASDSSQGRGEDGDRSGTDNGNNAEDNNDAAGEDAGEDGGQMCSSADLTPGTFVREAQLTISNSGAIWDKVELAAASH